MLPEKAFRPFFIPALLLLFALGAPALAEEAPRTEAPDGTAASEAQAPETQASPPPRDAGCSKGLAGDVLIPSLEDLLVEQVFEDVVASTIGGPQGEGYCRCGCGFQCNTSADCGGSPCQPYITCC